MATTTAIIAGLAGYGLALAAFLVFRWANQRYVEGGPHLPAPEQQVTRKAA